MDVLRISAAQHVSLPAQSVNQSGAPAVVQLTAQAGDVNLDDVAEALPVEVIEMLQQLGFRNNSARTVRQVFKDAIFHCRETDELTLAAHGQISGVDLDVANLQHRRTLSFAATDQRLSARQQFSKIERLGNIIVGAGVQQRDDRFFLV